MALTLDTVDEKGKKTKRCQFALYCSQRMRKDKGDNVTGFTSPNQMMRKFELKKGFNGDIMIRDLGFFTEGRGAEARFFIPAAQQTDTLLTKRLTGSQLTEDFSQ